MVLKMLMASLKRPCLVGFRPHFLSHPLHFFSQAPVEEFPRHLCARIELRAEFEPLPDLRARNFSGGRILHQIVDRHGPAAPEPGFDILHAHPDILAEARFGLACPRELPAAPSGRRDIIALDIKLVGRRHQGVEHLHGHGHEIGMRHPGAVMAVARFPLLVGPHLVKSQFDWLPGPCGLEFAPPCRPSRRPRACGRS